jgi:hypothetical protein
MAIQLIARLLIGIAVGAVIGSIFGILVGWVWLPHSLVPIALTRDQAIEWMSDLAIRWGGAGCIGGAVIAAASWLVSRHRIGKAISNRSNEIVNWKTMEMLFWATNGALSCPLHCVTGCFAKAAALREQSPVGLKSQREALCSFSTRPLASCPLPKRELLGNPDKT